MGEWGLWAALIGGFRGVPQRYERLQRSQREGFVGATEPTNSPTLGGASIDVACRGEGRTAEGLAQGIVHYSLFIINYIS